MDRGTPIRALAMQLLRLTSTEGVMLPELRGAVRMTTETFDSIVDALRDEGLVDVSNGTVTLSLQQRLSLAARALETGADFESVSRCLGWLEFEELSATVFEANGFSVRRRFRFQAEGRRWEIDILASRAPYLVCGECKHYGRGMGNSTARGIVEGHLAKVEVLSHSLQNIRERMGIGKWTGATVIPMMLTMSATPLEVYRRVPAVSVLALPGFLGEFDGQLDRLAHFRVELPPPQKKLKQMKLRERPSGSRPSRRL